MFSRIHFRYSPKKSYTISLKGRNVPEGYYLIKEENRTFISNYGYDRGASSYLIVNSEKKCSIETFLKTKKILPNGAIVEFEFDLLEKSVFLSVFEQYQEGECVEYYPGTGSKRGEGLLLDGKRDGDWFFWHPNGKVQAFGTYINGKKDGEWTSHHENGKIKSRGTFLKHRREGWWTFWNREGLNPNREFYEDGIFKKK